MADNKNLEKKDVAKKDKKDGLGKKISKFFREYKSELKKISWPTLPEVIKNSVVTIIVVLIVGLFIWVVDSVLTLGRDAILKVSNSSSATQDAGDTISDSDILDILYDAGYSITAISASDINASGSDLYTIALDGKPIDGFENYIASTAEDAEKLLLTYATTVPEETVTATDVVTGTDVTATDAE